MKPVRTRFAPSPTGFLHVGGVRTALFAWLVARQNGGQFILRIEDTDKAREVAGSIQHIQDSLKWLGLEWDEGPDKDGPHGPYLQSQRLDIYKQWAMKLYDEGKAYADPYSPEEVQAFREQAAAEKRPFKFRRHRPQHPPAWDGSQPLRLKSDALDDEHRQINDLVMGGILAHPDTSDDIILMKSDGYPTYNFAHIVDDYEMGITHVIRSQEFVSSFANYMNLYQAMGLWEQRPTLATLPHVMSLDGTKKLSKRDNAKDVLDYKALGYLPDALVNFLATLGWNDGSEQEIFSVDELIDKFRLSHVQRSPARFDERRLLWMNGHYIRELPLDTLYDKTADYWPAEAAGADEQYKKQVLGLVQERLKYFAELPELTTFFFAELPIDPELISGHKQLKKLPKDELKSLLEQARTSLEASDFSPEGLIEQLNNLLEKTAQKPAVLFSLIRIATTQAAASPGLAETLAVLGKERSLSRLDSQLSALV